VDHAYAVARAFSVTIEELVDGEAGAEYVGSVSGGLWEPRLRGIVDILKRLDDDQVKIVEKMIAGL
jgi:hypothetical protein